MRYFKKNHNLSTIIREIILNLTQLRYMPKFESLKPIFKTSAILLFTTDRVGFGT